MKSDYYFHRKNTKQYRRVHMCIYPANIQYSECLARGDLKSAENKAESARIAKLPPELQKTEGMVTCVSY